MAKKMGTGTKVALGVGVLALAGGIGYYFWKKSVGGSAAPSGDAPVSSSSFTSWTNSTANKSKPLIAPGTFKKVTSGCPTSCVGLEGTGKAVCNSSGVAVGFC